MLMQQGLSGQTQQVANLFQKILKLWEQGLLL